MPNENSDMNSDYYYFIIPSVQPPPPPPPLALLSFGLVYLFFSVRLLCNMICNGQFNHKVKWSYDLHQVKIVSPKLLYGPKCPVLTSKEVKRRKQISLVVIILPAVNMV